jgi:hypothetical protein
MGEGTIVGLPASRVKRATFLRKRLDPSELTSIRYVHTLRSPGFASRLVAKASVLPSGENDG